MELSSFLLIAFVVALALAPLAHFVPSKHQRRIASLREQAAVQGLFVEFRPPPDAVSQYQQALGPTRTIYYGLRFPNQRRREPSAQLWLRADGEWRASARRSAAPALLAPLPADVLAVGVDDHSCGVYWQERGEISEIDAICGVLQELVKELTA